MSDIFLAVHGLAIRKAANAAAVACLLGIGEADVAMALTQAVDDGLVIGANGMFMVSSTGQEWLAAHYPIVYADIRADGALAVAYESFEKVNTALLTLFTDWQTMPAGDTRVSNDHNDADYDQKIINRLGTQHDRAERVITRCAGSDERYRRYLERLEVAFDRALAGDVDFVSGVRVESYHTVWYELHEDLLRALARTRRE